MAPSSVVLYPSPGMGHLVSMFELAKLLTNHNLSVTILIVELHNNPGSTASFIACATSSNPSISFHHLPTITPPPNFSPNFEAAMFDTLRLSNPNLHRFLSSSLPSALIMDMFCTYAFSVSAQLGIPSFIFFTSGANCLSFFLHVPKLNSATTSSFRELGSTKLDIPSIPPLRADHVPVPMLDRDDDAYRAFLYMSERLPKAKGIIINTVDAIEQRAVDGIHDAGSYPPLYCIGPLIKSDEGEKSSESSKECLHWLDTQPKASVVFLCFGSLGLFSGEQLREMAVALEQSEQRFLWAVRSPPEYKARPEPNLDRILPEGFLKRTKNRGMVVKSWAPQAAVLRHEAVGGFVTHCGWNSILEAICGGVPMIGWPLYAEQKMNLVFMVEEMKLAVGIEGYNDGGVVRAEEIEGKIRWLMEMEEGKELRDRMVEAKEKALKALMNGGPSNSALMGLAEELKGRE